MFDRRALTCTLVLTALTFACGNSDGPRAGEEAADTTAMALAQYDAAMFDSIQWPADSAALSRGGVVWAVSCAKCHGMAGEGDGRFVLRGDTLKPPTFLADDWQFAQDRDLLKQKIYAGTNTGMPHWGVVGLKPRDIDAVSRYIIDVLRRPSVARY